jgi:hypothetical protein
MSPSSTRPSRRGSNSRVLELANDPGRWSAGHAMFGEIRQLLLTSANATDELRVRQYDFEESCCKVMYNATDPPAPFDSRTAFFVAGKAIRLAEVAGVPTEEVVIVLTGAVRLTELAQPANERRRLSP